jgi:hypothetical protein
MYRIVKKSLKTGVVTGSIQKLKPPKDQLILR